MSEFNHTAFENNIIDAVTQVAFGNLNSLLVCDRGSLHYVVLMLFIVINFLVCTFWVLVCLPSNDIFVLLHILFGVTICFEPGTIRLLYLVQNN
jgi:hypothetical protein